MAMRRGANRSLDGGNAGSTNYYALYDIQKRQVVRPMHSNGSLFKTSG